VTLTSTKDNNNSHNQYCLPVEGRTGMEGLSGLGMYAAVVLCFFFYSGVPEAS
jgi:hypothetical protein